MKSDQPARRKLSGAFFIIKWIFNNVIAMAVGIVAGGMFGMTSFLRSRTSTEISTLSTGDILVGLFIGLVAGYLQSAQLKPWLGSRLAWIAASTLGWALATVGYRNASTGNILQAVLMYGLPLILGVLQWFILRREFDRAGWWIALSYLGVILTLVWLADLLVRYASASSAANPLGMFIPLVLFPLPYSLITGLGMSWLIRRSQASPVKNEPRIS